MAPFERKIFDIPCLEVLIRTLQHDVFRIHLSNLSGTYRCNFEVLGQERICEIMPIVARGIRMKECLDNGINLSEHQGRPIEILFAADVSGNSMTSGYKRLPSGLVWAIETKLGWTVMGRNKQEGLGNNYGPMVSSMLSKDIPVTKLWNVDILGITDSAQKQTKEELEEAAKECFVKTLKRLPNGCYEVSLPWVEGHRQLLNNRWLAERILKSTIKTLRAKNLLKNYEEVFSEWQREGVIEPVNVCDTEESNCFYFLHHAVVKEQSTTKIRPVFDASVKQKNCPLLNDCLGKGPRLLELILSILNRFRWRKFGVISDIRKAFLQSGINEKDINYLILLWCEDKRTEVLKIYRHTRVVFGINASPFLFDATISCHLEQVPTRHRELAKKLKNSFYVDNCVTSLDTKNQIEDFIIFLKEIMSAARFELRGWRHNEDKRPTYKPTNITDTHIEKVKRFEENVSVLGLEWNIFEDTLPTAADSGNPPVLMET